MMDYTSCCQYMRQFFEKYYAQLEEESPIALMFPMDESEKAMWSDDADPNEEWKKWKLVPSTVTDQEIEQLEEEIGIQLPKCLRAFLTVYHHHFGEPIGSNSIIEPFYEIRNAWNPLLVKCGYLPFTWAEDGYYIRCINLEHMPDEEQCGIYQIDHEALFSMDEDTVQKGEIEQNMEYISQNLFTYLESFLGERESL